MAWGTVRFNGCRELLVRPEDWPNCRARSSRRALINLALADPQVRADGKSRLETLCLLVVGMLGARTVNLGHIATTRGGTALPASTYRRLQRFFQHVRLDPDWAVPMLAAMIGTGRWILTLDRTNWKIARTEVNFLVLAAVTRRLPVPLFWVPLPRGGNSATGERIALLRRYLARFEVSTIRILLADREFVGAKWLKLLNDNNIPFAIRM